MSDTPGSLPEKNLFEVLSGWHGQTDRPLHWGRSCVDQRDWMRPSATQIRRRKTTPSASGLASHTVLSEAGVLGDVLPPAKKPLSSPRKAKGHTSGQPSEMIRDNGEELPALSGIAVPHDTGIATELTQPTLKVRQTIVTS
jgi:hypothetical protein